jgi:hypothetical protein
VADTERQTAQYRRPLSMQRGLTQLLFSYLPDRTVDWEDGAAIIKLDGVRLDSVWEGQRAATVLDEIDDYLGRWRRRGGSMDQHFEDLRLGRKFLFTVGAPESVRARYLPTILVCRKCSRIHFRKPGELARADGSGWRCRRCHAATLRQFGIVFVHGCGALVAVEEFIPIASDRGGTLAENRKPLRCLRCGENSDLALKTPPRSERIKNISIVCLHCGEVYLDKFTAQCHACLRELLRARRDGADDHPGITAITRIKMRATSYRASEAYYPVTLTMMRLDLPEVVHAYDPEIKMLRQLLPDAGTGSPASFSDAVAALTEQMRAAAGEGRHAEVARLTSQLQELVRSQSKPQPLPAAGQAWYALVRDDEEWQAELERGVKESIALRHTVRTVEVTEVLRQNPKNGSSHIEHQLQLQRQLGIREMLVVEDLPVIVASFGYTRRSSEPTFEEDRKQMPTRVRAFPRLDEAGLRLVGQPQLKGTIPVLAREGRHEGLFLSLEPELVVGWLERNQVQLPLPGAPPVVRVLHALEKVDRFYDNVERECPVRRLVFGLVHSLSHLVMRVAGRYAGLERTSLSEYLFLPLLGCVVFDNSGSFQLGGLRLLVRDHLLAFLRALEDEAVSCLYDTACIDHKGACHGCVHAPEISCRYFNHGLSRAYLTGGHAPWADVADERQVRGYWEV